MYDFLEKTGNPVGILNDFDLATWVGHSTTNNDRMGTIPFMAIDLLNGGLTNSIPRLYRHDMESFVWVLAFVTVAEIEYKDCAISISPLLKVEAWFRDVDQKDRETHISLKRSFHVFYGYDQQVSICYSDYLNPIQQVIRYCCDFHRPRIRTYTLQLGQLIPIPVQGPATPELDPTGSLKRFITRVGDSLGEEVKALLLEAVEIPTATINAV